MENTCNGIQGVGEGSLFINRHPPPSKHTPRTSAIIEPEDCSHTRISERALRSSVY